MHQAKSPIIVPSGNVDTDNLPPCRRSLSRHIRRANHQVGIWKRAHIPEPTIPKASQGHGWEEIEDGCIDPLWFDGDVLPGNCWTLLKIFLRVLMRIMLVMLILKMIS